MEGFTREAQQTPSNFQLQLFSITYILFLYSKNGAPLETPGAGEEFMAANFDFSIEELGKRSVKSPIRLSKVQG
ncbi:MAG: hypothetical protein LBF83_10845, partial [Spirochaetaceae bacterium]|nr:hypothetical protein [Spirochaetaceae bacterium]